MRGEPVRRFRDRRDAGRQLGERLAGMDLVAPIVLALPRGGVPVAYEVARALDAPLDVFVARKLGAPAHPELGIGAIAEDGGRVVDARSVQVLGVTERQLDEVEALERQELARRVARYRGERSLPDMTGRDVVLVDDGLATGVTAQAALQALRARRPRRLILAVPVCAPDTATRLAAGSADAVVCLQQPEAFRAVGLWYDDFSQTTDREVEELVAAAKTP